MALVGTAAPMVTDLKQADELLMLCSSIGMTDHDETSADVYHKGDEAREVLQDLTRVLRREDKHSKHSYLRQLGVIQVFQKDLVPLLVQYGGFGNDVPADRATKENNKMVFALLKLMVAMTMPAMITFDGALEKIEETREFAQVVDFLRDYKAALIAERSVWDPVGNEMSTETTSPTALEALLKILYLPLTVEQRTSKQEDIIELVLLIVRNVLHVPNPKEVNPTRETLQDRTILAFDKVGIFNLVILLGNDVSNNEIFVGHLMEIIVYALNGQTPAGLVRAHYDEAAGKDTSAARSAHRNRAAAVLKERREREEDIERAKRQFQSSRHPRFGGAFLMRQIANATDENAVETNTSVGGKQRFYAHPVKSLLNPVSRSDEGKIARKKKKAGNPALDNPERKESPSAVRQVLYNFVKRFLREAYNLVMPIIYRSIENSAGKGDKVMQTDEVHYCQMLRFFMEFHRLDSERQHALDHPETTADTSSPDVVDVGIVAATLRRDDLKYTKDLIMKYAIQIKEDASGAVLWSQRLHHALRAFHELLTYLDLLHHSTDADKRDFSVCTQADLFYEFEFLETLPRIARTFTPTKQSEGFARDVILTIHLVLRMLQLLQKSEAFKFFMKKKTRGGKKKSTASKSSGNTSTGTPDREGVVAGAKENADTSASAAPATQGDSADLSALFESGGVANDGDSASANPSGDTEDAAASVKEFEFDFSSYEVKFADAKLIKTYTKVLQGYRTNGSVLNHAIIKMFHRIFSSDHCDKRWLFYQLSVFNLFHIILNDQTIRKNKKFSELRGFVKEGVVKSFFADAERYPPLFAEVLFWKSAEDVNEIELGPSRAEMFRKRKAFKWSMAAEDTLRDLFTKYSQEEDALEKITEGIRNSVHQECADRTEASVRSKLGHMRLYLLPVARWSEQELEELRELYSSYTDAGEADPLQVIVDDNVFHPSKNTVGKLRNQLKKMGLDVGKKGAPTPWSEVDEIALRELYDGFKDVFTGINDITAAVLEDDRMRGKTSGTVKKKLKDLGLYTPKASKPRRSKAEGKASSKKKKKGKRPSRTSRPGRQAQRRKGGELDHDFAESLASCAARIRDQGDAAAQQLTWLLTALGARAQVLEDVAKGDLAAAMRESDDEEDSSADVQRAVQKAAAQAPQLLTPPDGFDPAACLKPLVGMLGFVQAADSSSDSDDDGEGASKGSKAPQWEIGSSVPATRLRDMIDAMSPGDGDDQDATLASGSDTDGHSDGSQSEAGSDIDVSASDDASSDDDEPSTPRVTNITATSPSNRKSGPKGTDDVAAAAEDDERANVLARKRALQRLIAQRKERKTAKESAKKTSVSDIAESAKIAAAEQAAEDATQGTPRAGTKKRRLRVANMDSDEDSDAGDDDTNTGSNMGADMEAMETAAARTYASDATGVAPSTTPAANRTTPITAQTLASASRRGNRMAVLDSDDSSDDDVEPDALAAHGEDIVPDKTSHVPAPSQASQATAKRAAVIDSDDSSDDDEGPPDLSASPPKRLRLSVEPDTEENADNDVTIAKIADDSEEDEDGPPALSDDPPVPNNADSVDGKIADSMEMDDDEAS